ncbi:putative CMGC SRPK protein kinase [Venturia nashicola]|uniref:non-specific serine/threonine protein kinase n=1 Tax=Venturia nashicola TaxID=86259 RepID=A0A4Z1NKG4_9PEZI|nr:putative CMGC SRPK protein kinase [Venturia nashicola]
MGHMDQSPHICGVNAEPLHRYRRGGYHPIRLGELLKDGREQRYVAIKNSVSERGATDKEGKVLRAIAATRPEHPGYRHIVQLLDHFELSGPNGTQNCFVLEVLRPIVPDLLDARFRDERLTGKLAKDIAKQALLGLDYLHQQKIGHGGGPALLNSSSDISYAYQICTLAT